MMSSLLPCDLGDGIEVLHDVESVEIEMDCDLEDASAPQPLPLPPPWTDDTERTFKVWFETDDDSNTATFERDTTTFEREPGDELGTHRFARYSAPYERIEIQLDANAFIKATIEDVRRRRR